MSKNHKQKWLLYAPLGLILIGAGLSCFGEALIWKYEQAPFWNWFAFGTFSLVLFNSGLCFFGEAIIARVQYLKNKS